jgi:hypothetical protein
MAFWSFLWWWLRFPLAILAMLVILLLGGVAWLLSGQRYQTFLTEQLSARLHAQVRVARSELSIAQGLGLELHGVEVQPEAAPEPILTAERVAILLDVRSFFRGQLLFHRVEWVNPRIYLTESAKRPFAVFGALLSEGEAPTSSGSRETEWWTPTLALRYVKVIDSEIFYHREERNAPSAITRADATLIFVPDHGVQFQLEAELGAKGKLGLLSLRAHLPYWDARADISQVAWTGHIRCDRLVLRELGRHLGREWPGATLAFDGRVIGKGFVPSDLTGTVRVKNAHFGSVQVQHGTINLKKFLWAEDATATKPATWTTMLETAEAEFDLDEAQVTLKDPALQLLLHTGTGVLRAGDLTIADLSGQVGARSRVLVASGTLKQVTSSKGPVPDLTVKAELDVQADLPDLLEMLTKFGLPDVTPHVRKPQGYARIDMAVRATKPGGPLSSDGSIQLREVGFSVPTLKTDVRDLTGTVTVSNDALLLDTVAFRVGHTTLQVTGQVGAYRSARRKSDLHLTADVDLSDLDRIVSIGRKFWPALSSQTENDLSQFMINPQGRAAVRLALQTTGSADAPLFDGSMTFRQAAFQVPRWNSSVTDLSGTLQIGRDSLSTPGMSFMVGSASLRAQGSLRDYLTRQRVGEVRLAFTEVPDAEVSALLPSTLIHPQGGTVGGLVDLIFTGTGEWYTRGEVTLTRIQLDPLPKVLRTFTVDEGELLWEGQSGTFVITRGSATGSPFHGQGRIRSFAPLNIEAALDFPVLNVESIFHLEEQPPAPEQSPKNKTVVAQVDVTAEQLTYKTFRADRVRASCHWHDRQADIHVVSARTAGGQVQGAAVVWPDFDALFVAPQFAAVQVPQLLTVLGASSDVLTGAFSGGGQIYIPDRHLWNSLAHWQAQLSLEVENGVAQRVPILVRLWSAVSLQAVLKLQFPSLPLEGLAFSSLNGDFAVGGGITVTRNLSLQSSAVRLSADGEINLADRTVNLKTTFSPLHGITSSVAKVPLAGQVLARGAEILTTLPFRVSGPYHDPTVMPLVVDLGSREHKAQGTRTGARSFFPWR